MEGPRSSSLELAAVCCELGKEGFGEGKEKKEEKV